MRTVALIQARMTSTRLRGKVLADVDGLPLLICVAQRVRAVQGLDGGAVLLSGDLLNEPIVHTCHYYRVPVWVCPDLATEDVLGRYARAVLVEGIDVVLRVTGDCSLIDPAVCVEVLRLLAAHPEADYAGATQPETDWADGLDCEAVRGAALLEADSLATDPADREHVTRWIRRRPARCRYLPCPEDLRPYKWSVDTQEDLRRVRAIYHALPPDRPTSWWQTLQAAHRAERG